MAAVHTINRGSARNPAMNVVMRELFLAAAQNSFEMKSQYINTKLNVMADAISRGDVERFVQHATEVLGMKRSDLREVEPNLDVEKMLKKMQKAMRAKERRQRKRLV